MSIESWDSSPRVLDADQIADLHAKDPNVALFAEAAYGALRSTREFSDRAIDPPTMLQIIRAGTSVTGSKNTPPAHYHVIYDPALRETICTAASTGHEALLAMGEKDLPFNLRTQEYRGPDTTQESVTAALGAAVIVLVENRTIFSGGMNALMDAENSDQRRAIYGLVLEAIGIGGQVRTMRRRAMELKIASVEMGDLVGGREEVETELGMEGEWLLTVLFGYPVEVMPPRPVPTSSELANVVSFYGQPETTHE